MDTDRTPRVVPFGYEPPEGRRKGALVVYDAFDSEENGAFLDTAAAAADRLRFATLVLYPIHEETLRRMTKSAPFERFAFRLDRLHDWKRKRGPTSDFDIAVDNWEGKRKKYTPIDAALRHIAEQYRPPHFLFLAPPTANLFASYDSFGDWITRIRLLIADPPAEAHPMLERHRSEERRVGKECRL